MITSILLAILAINIAWLVIRVVFFLRKFRLLQENSHNERGTIIPNTVAVVQSKVFGHDCIAINFTEDPTRVPETSHIVVLEMPSIPTFIRMLQDCYESDHQIDIDSLLEMKSKLNSPKAADDLEKDIKNFLKENQSDEETL